MADKLYNTAAHVITNALFKKGSIKNLCFSSEYRNKRKLYALVSETLKHKKVIEKILNEVEVHSNRFQENENLKLVLTYECVFGKGLPNNCSYRDVFATQDRQLLQALEDVTVDNPHLLTQQSKQLSISRYVRVNVLKNSTDDVIERFRDHGYTFITKETSNLKDGEFSADVDIPDVLVFPPNTDLHASDLYKQGKIFLQDKASCLPAFILDPPPGSLIIDACAAPGNKSSHLACIVKNDGIIYSFDLDKKRLMTMKSLLHKAAATCIRSKHQDFLKVRHDDRVLGKVEYILLDPSCSGSGIVSRMNDLVDTDIDGEREKKRLRSLAGFQTAVLSHALTFPHVKRVVYSTCSINKEENEDVVEKAFKRFSATFELVQVMTSWKNRGLGDWDEAYKCIRANPEQDNTNGFFVAMFQRRSLPSFPNHRQNGSLQSDVITPDYDEDHFDNDIAKKPRRNEKRKFSSKVDKEENENCSFHGEITNPNVNDNRDKINCDNPNTNKEKKKQMFSSKTEHVNNKPKKTLKEMSKEVIISQENKFQRKVSTKRKRTRHVKHPII